MKDDGKQEGSGPPPVPVEESTPWYENLLASLGERVLGLPVRRVDTLVTILLIVIADACLYDAPGGTGAACVVVACVVALHALAGGCLRGSDLVLPVVVVLAAGMMVWHSWWLLSVMVWASLVVLAVKLHRSDWRLLESLWAACWTMGMAPLKALGHIVAGAMRGADDGGGAAGKQRKVPVRAVVIPLAVCILFIFIFSAANPVVARLTEDFRRIVAECFDYLFEAITIGRVFTWLLWMMLFAALIRPTAKSFFADFLAKLDQDLRKPAATKSDDGNYTTVLATLISINIVFLAYNCIDANYLWFKAALPGGITWADYTHAGCGWLTFGLFVSTLVIGVMFWRRLNFHPRADRLKLLCYVWAAQNGLLAVGAIRRLQMYIDYSGLTHLRITGIYGSILVASGLAIMVGKVRSNRSFTWLLHNYVLAFAIALVVLALTPADWLCASYNVAKVMEGKPRALRPICLKELSPGALPPLIPLLDYGTKDGDPDKERLVRDGIAALLYRHLAKLEAEESAGWSRWQLSSVWALGHLRAAREHIEAAVPSAHRGKAEQQLRANYDLTEPVPAPEWPTRSRPARR